jgi:DNA-damage-inducible protein J
MAVVSVRMDDATKTQLDEFCETVGLSTSAVFKMLAKKVVREKRIPFEVEVDPFYSPANLASLKERIDDSEAGRNVTEHDIVEVYR